MAAHEKRTRTVVHREWTLKLPAHSSDVAKAITEVHEKHGMDPDATSDVTVYAVDDELLVIGYTTRQETR